MGAFVHSRVIHHLISGHIQSLKSVVELLEIRQYYFYDLEAKMSKDKKHQKNYSTISEHKHQGKKLIPPFVHNFNMTYASWKDDRLPEKLWAVLLVTHLPRENALNVFRRVAKYIEDLPEDDKFLVTPSTRR